MKHENLFFVGKKREVANDKKRGREIEKQKKGEKEEDRQTLIHSYKNTNTCTNI